MTNLMTTDDARALEPGERAYELFVNKRAGFKVWHDQLGSWREDWARLERELALTPSPDVAGLVEEAERYLSFDQDCTAQGMLAASLIDRLCTAQPPNPQQGVPGVEKIAEAAFDAHLWTGAWKRANEAERNSELHCAQAIHARIIQAQEVGAMSKPISQEIAEAIISHLGDERETMVNLIANTPAHMDDRGPNNTNLIDHIPIVGGEVPGMPSQAIYWAVDRLLSQGFRLYPKAAERAGDGGWQPIETAPKDGTHILLLGVLKHDRVTIGFYDDDGSSWWAYFHPRLPMGGDLNPTHWQPLPSPPPPEARSAGLLETDQ